MYVRNTSQNGALKNASENFWFPAHSETHSLGIYNKSSWNPLIGKNPDGVVAGGVAVLSTFNVLMVTKCQPPKKFNGNNVE